MKKTELDSIHNSGESFEKCVAMYYCTLQQNIDFYSNFNVNVFYSHNLPKKNNQLSAHGTVSFYEKYFSDFYWCPPCKKEYLWNIKNDVLNNLIKQGIISCRVAEKLSGNFEHFCSIVEKLPFEYLYPEFYDKLIYNSQKILSNVNFISTKLEQNYKLIYSNLGNNKTIYSIYALEQNGIIGHYDMFLDDDYRYDKRLEHLFKDLGKRPVLSGNSAILLASIDALSIDKSNLLGYREHKQSRYNRDEALNYILGNREGIIEPKNRNFNKYYDYVDSNMELEDKSNEVVALAYGDYIKANVKCLKL